MTPDLVIWGAGEIGRLAVEIARLTGSHRVVGLLDDLHPERAGDALDGVPILGGGEQLPTLRERGIAELVIAFGNPAAKPRVAALARDAGFRSPTLVHPRASVSHGAELGDGVIVRAGVVVDLGATVGDHVLLNVLALVGHGATIGDGALISGGARVGGHSRVGRGAWVGIGATISSGAQVGAGAIIGAGAVVLRDVPPGMVAFGVPARVARPATPADFSL